jgi:hypothetical protein
MPPVSIKDRDLESSMSFWTHAWHLAGRPEVADRKASSSTQAAKSKSGSCLGRELEGPRAGELKVLNILATGILENATLFGPTLSCTKGYLRLPLAGFAGWVSEYPLSWVGIDSSRRLSRIVRNLTGYLQRRYTNYIDGSELMIRMIMTAMIKPDMVIIACLA